MLKDYLMLGLLPDAQDEQIRKRYLSLVKQYTPERDPDRFQEISTAYERIKDESSRIKSQLFDPMKITDPEKAIQDFVRAASPQRRRVGLQTLLEAVRKN